MHKKTLLSSILVAGLTVSLMTGCGSSASTQDTLTSGASGAAPGGTQESVVVAGRVTLGEGIPGAQVEITGSSGKLPITATTDSTGHFYFKGFSNGSGLSRDGLPRDFRVTAKVAGLELAAEVRGYGYNEFDRVIVVNIPTTLASRYAAAHPQVSLAEAEAKVKKFLRIPSDYSLQFHLGEGPASPFSHLAFFRRAETNGGGQAFLDRVASSLDASLQESLRLGAPFRTGYNFTRGGYNGLDPTLNQFFTRLVNQPDVGANSGWPAFAHIGWPPVEARKHRPVGAGAFSVRSAAR